MLGINGKEPLTFCLLTRYNVCNNLIGRLGGRISQRLGRKKVQFWTIISVLFLIGAFVVVQRYWPLKEKKSENERVSAAYEDLFLKDYDGVIKNLADVDKFSESLREEAYMALGQAYFAKAEYAKASENYQKAENLAESDKKKSYYNNLVGNCLRENKDKDGAVSKYKLAVQLDPKNESAWVNMINLYRISGDISDAKNVAKAALLSIPSDGPIQAIEKSL